MLLNKTFILGPVAHDTGAGSELCLSSLCQGIPPASPLLGQRKTMPGQIPTYLPQLEPTSAPGGYTAHMAANTLLPSHTLCLQFNNPCGWLEPLNRSRSCFSYPRAPAGNAFASHCSKQRCVLHSHLRKVYCSRTVQDQQS